MKIKYIIPIIIFTGASILNSCSKEEFGPVLEITQTPEITLPATGTAFVLTDETADNTMTTFTWSSAKFKVNIENSYALEVDLTADNFANAKTLTVTGDTTFAVTVFDFNKFLTVDMGLTPGVAKQISVRVGTPAEADSSARTYSEPITLTVTPYNPPFTPDQLYVITNGATAGKLLPTDENGNYEGYAWIAAADLSFILSDAETGGTILGDNGDDGIADFNGDAIVSAMFQVENSTTFNEADIIEGYYKININTFDMSLEVYEISWSVIGNAINPYAWNGDIDLTYSVTEGVWSAVINDIHTGEFKFRANHSWDPFNYGDDGVDGIPDGHGANIAITEGAYTITLDLREYPYSYSVTANK